MTRPIILSSHTVNADEILYFENNVTHVPQGVPPFYRFRIMFKRGEILTVQSRAESQVQRDLDTLNNFFKSQPHE